MFKMLLGKNKMSEYETPTKCPLCGHGTISKPRSLKQNRYMFGVPYRYLVEYFKQFGYTKEDVHEICKHKFLAQKVIAQAGVTIPPSTTTLTTIEMEEYLESIRRWAAELGCSIPEPREEEKNVSN